MFGQNLGQVLLSLTDDTMPLYIVTKPSVPRFRRVACCERVARIMT